MGELVNRGESAIVPEGFYKQVSSILNAARDKAYTAVNFAMVEAYWEIGKSIVDEQGGEGRAKYGDALIDELAVRLTKDFGRGFNARSLRYMRQFYLAFPIRNALRSELNWRLIGQNVCPRWGHRRRSMPLFQPFKFRARF